MLLLLLLLCHEFSHPDQDQTCSVQTRSNMFSPDKIRHVQSRKDDDDDHDDDDDDDDDDDEFS